MTIWVYLFLLLAGVAIGLVWFFTKDDDVAPEVVEDVEDTPTSVVTTSMDLLDDTNNCYILTTELQLLSGQSCEFGNWISNDTQNTLSYTTTNYTLCIEPPLFENQTVSVTVSTLNDCAGVLHNALTNNIEFLGSDTIPQMCLYSVGDTELYKWSTSCPSNLSISRSLSGNRLIQWDSFEKQYYRRKNVNHTENGRVVFDKEYLGLRVSDRL
jgi:hypothetical protein